MAVTAHAIQKSTVVGTSRVKFGSWTQSTDADGDVPATLATVEDFKVVSPTVVDNDCAFYRNASAVTEYAEEPTRPHLGGKVHFTGLDNSGDPTYRYVVWGV